jgi:hypothetical protein
MKGVTERHRGRVIKTIGDELMCVFPDAERGFLAATDMQTLVNALTVLKGVKRMIRVGFHAGPVIEEKGDVFGDTVNVAARMAGLAKGMQIMTTRTTVDALPAALRASTRRLPRFGQGQGDDLAVCEVLWQEGDDLTMAAGATAAAEIRFELELRHGAKEIVLGERDEGRVDRARRELRPRDRRPEGVAPARANRAAARQVLPDRQSTNGTYVTFAGEPRSCCAAKK